MWLTLAAAHGETQAREALEELDNDLTTSQIADAQQRAADWRPLIH
jgi:hypothetical protein